MRPQLIHSIGLEHVPHGFSTRAGGVSSGPFESLNFGNPGDLPPPQRDPGANIRENWRLTLAAIGASGRELVEVHQVHGAAVHVVRRDSGGEAGGGVKADAIVTDDPARVIAVRVADCAPVLVASQDGRVVAAIHAGWRGVISGVVAAAVGAMRELAVESCEPGLSAAIGPCIGVDAFEVGPEVVAEFERAFGPGSPHIRPGARDRAHIDLSGALSEQLRRAGVARDDVHATSCCTYSDPGRFFSHRRATHGGGVATGRMAAMIGPAPA